MGGSGDPPEGAPPEPSVAPDSVDPTRAEVREGERLFRAIFSGAQVAIAVSDPAGEILEANPAAEVLFEAPRAKLVGRRLPGLLFEGRGVRWDEILSSRQQGEIELRLAGRAVKQVEYAVTAEILPGRHLAVMRDVTDERQRASRLALADKMAAAGRMAAGLARELDAPLSSVSAKLGHLEEALRAILDAAPTGARARGGSSEPLAKDLARALSDARHGIGRMRIILRDLLLFSRSDEGFRQSVDVVPLLESCLDKALEAIQHPPRLDKAFTAVPPATGNAALLAEVFFNLLVNAAQAMGEGGPTPLVRISTSLARDGRIAVEVADSGAGIAPADLPRIFDPFFTARTGGVGTGLALSICHKLVKSCGGELEALSEAGRGSTFRVLLLPAKAATAAPAALPTPGAEGRATVRGRILVVDDEPLVGVALKRALGGEHDLTVVSSAADALARLRRGERFDLLLSDLLMPEMTGMELYQIVSREMPSRAPPFLFLTGGAFTDVARRFLEEHAADCVEKPFEVMALRELVRRRIAGARSS